MRDFKKLLVWQRAYALSIEVHDAVLGIRRGNDGRPVDCRELDA